MSDQRSNQAGQQPAEAAPATNFACLGCGAIVDVRSRYCPNCGALTARPERSGASLQLDGSDLDRAAEDRRVVTVLFADLTGSTNLGERLDAEELRSILERFFEALAREVMKLGGTVDKYVGDEVMAVFGAPVAHEDDAVRAVTAAAAMQRAMSGLNTSLGLADDARLELRIGINTGEVVAGPLAGNLQDAYTVVGDAVNVAKRIQSAARPGEIVVGERTRQATGRIFEYDALAAIAVKGKSAPIQAHRFARARTSSGEASPSAGTKLIGRVPERETLLTAINAVASGAGGIVAIVGEPGIGKTRMLLEARAAARVAGVTWLQGQASSHGQTLSYLPFREMLRALAGIDTADDDKTKWSKLERAVAAVLPQQVDEITPYLGTIVALGVRDRDRLRLASLDGDAMRRQVLRGTYVLFEAIARAHPTAIVFEDWHWVDRSSEQLLTHLLPLKERLLFIWTGRPEKDSSVERTVRNCADVAGAAYKELALGPLSADESGALLCDALSTTAIPAGLRDAVVRRSEGNPFFAEEILRALRDLNLLTHDDTKNEWVLAEKHSAGALPTTVHGVIAARIDRLTDDAKHVARVAAVIGRTFRYRMLVAVSDRDIDRGLDELLELSVIREQRGGERSYAFTHALVQEAVYAGLLVRTRRNLHAHIAAAMEALLRESIEEHYGVLAYHYAQAEEWGKAQEYLFKVGDQAQRIAADAEAVDHYERALDAYGRAFGDRWEPMTRAAVERKIGEARYRLGEFERATIHLDRSLGLLGFARPRSRFGIRLAIGGELLRQAAHRIAPMRTGTRSGQSEEISESVLQAFWFHQFIDYSSDLERLLYDILRTLNIAERAAPSHRTLRAYFGMTLMCHNIGLRGMGGRYARMADAMAQRIGGAVPEAIAKASLGLDHYAVGQWPEAAEELAASATGYLAAGELEAWAGINGYLNTVLIGQGRLEEASPIPDELERIGREARDRRIEALGPHCRAHLLSWGGRELEAVGEYERAISIYRSIPDRHLWLGAAGALARTQLRLGDTAAARVLVEEGLQLAKTHRLSGWWLTHLLDAHVELLLREAASGNDKAAKLDEAGHVCNQLARQGRLHFEAVPAAHRQRGSWEWLRGNGDAAAKAWRRSLDASQRVGALTEEFETHDAIARYALSQADLDAAQTITARLHDSMTATA
jgi:class 3 adenylate cyclase/tetratricopeptide (TPR) repeat protein